MEESNYKEVIKMKEVIAKMLSNYYLNKGVKYKMNKEKREIIYKILKVLSAVECCKTDCPLYYFCNECDNVCEYLEKLDNKLINE